MKKEYLECGKIVCQHGVRGAVKIESWCDSPEALAALPVLYLDEKSGGFSVLTRKDPPAPGRPQGDRRKNPQVR